MSIWDLWKGEATAYVHGQLHEDQCPARNPRRPVQPDAEYVEVYLRRMWIPHVRIGTNRFYAAVHSDLALWHDSGSFANFKQVIAPPEGKDVPTDRMERIIFANQPLLGPTPYRGGRLALNVVLLSVKSTDLAGPYIELLSDIAGAAGVSYVAMARPFLKSIGTGIELLSGTAGASVREIQLATNLAPVESGIYVVLRAPSESVRLDDLRVHDDYTLTHAGGQDLRTYPYFVISVEAASSRVDWKGIPDLKMAYQRVEDALRRDMAPEVKDAMGAFRRAALLSEDLLAPHARELVRQVEATVDEVMGEPLQGSRTMITPPALDAFDPFREAA